MYSIKELALMAKTSARTLRFYEDKGLLSPKRTDNNYRYFTTEDLTRVFVIKVYKEIGFSIAQIKEVLKEPAQVMLHENLELLKKRSREIDAMITFTTEIIQNGGEYIMNEAKFKALIEEQVTKNEKQFGKEVRSKFGNEVVDASNAMLRNKTPEQISSQEELTNKVIEALLLAIEQGDYKSSLAKEAALLHRKWLKFYWKEYSTQAHKNLADGYLADARFISYYDKHKQGLTQFLRDAIHFHLE